jgi:predicted transcriptional regulator
VAEAATGRVALMAIHPEYAEAILDGTKTVEFRKRALAHDVLEVWIYATSPISRVVGRFFVDEVVDGTPAEIWRAYGSQGCISKQDYCKYYRFSERAYGILVRCAERLPAVSLEEFEPKPAVPQSYSYLPEGTKCQGIYVNSRVLALF